MLYLLLALYVVLFVFMIISMKKEKAIIGFYKAQGLFGRAYAYFFCDFLAVGICVIVASIISSDMIISEIGVIGLLAGIIFGLALIGVSVLMYIRVYKKCPGELRKRLFMDLLMAAVGFSTRVALFVLVIFIHTWFELNKPTEYVVNGRTVYAYPGSKDLYDSSGFKVGEANDDFTKAHML